jgi:N-acetylglucosamine-6-phosphate deacetylase
MTKGRQHAVLASTIFDGELCHAGSAVVIEGPTIAAVVACGELPASMPRHSMPDGAWLAPGFIDCQVNGGGGVLFNDEPSAEGIAAIVAAHRKFGTTSLLPTLITDEPGKLRTALRAASEAAAAMPGVAGIHLEGPFISPQKPGVHAGRFIRAPTADDLALLTAPRSGVTLVTLAPECVPVGFVSKLACAGIRVSLGHSVATYDQTKAAFAEGLTGFTHLFNAMPQLSSRGPGPIAAALETPAAFFGMIVDGEHVHPAMLRLALRGVARPMLITDAMPCVGGVRPGFKLYGEDIAVRDGRCVRADGALAGAALDMAAAIRNCVEQLYVSLPGALRFASAAPAAFLGLSNLGRVAPGYRADLVAFDPSSMEIYETWVAGQPSPAP